MNQAWLLGQTERNFKLSTKWTWIVSADFLSSKLIFFTVLNSTTIWENPGLTKVLPEGGTNLTRQYLQCNMGIMLICSINGTETSSWSSKFTLKIQTQSFYSHDAMIAGVLAMTLCMSIRHKSVFYRNGWTIWADFWYGSFLPDMIHCIKRKFRYLQK